jgi:hypothetical protein
MALSDTTKDAGLSYVPTLPFPAPWFFSLNLLSLCYRMANVAPDITSTFKATEGEKGKIQIFCLFYKEKTK